MTCSICLREMGGEEPAFVDDAEGVAFAICQACSHHEGGIVLDDDEEPDNYTGDFGLGGNWWQDEDSK